jgi:large subunit ribosomal protein L28
MAYSCSVCGKGPRAGFSVSHSHVGTKRRFLPNLQKVRVKTSSGTQRKYVCTSCIKSGKVKKA